MPAPPVQPTLAGLSSGSLARYWRFHQAVVGAQLVEWLPARRGLLVDISGGTGSSAAKAAARGHTVVRVITAMPAPPVALPAADVPPPRWPSRRGGRVVSVAAEPGSLEFLHDGCADGVIAESGTMSHCLMTEDLASEIARVLRPGGRLLASVDSLVLGMAMLAEQNCWAHLVDAPHAEVMLVPWPDGTITRCFGAGQLRDLLSDAGLDVTWVRPRTVLSPSMVDHVLRREPSAMQQLVRAELLAGRNGSAVGPDESFGISLVADACKVSQWRRSRRDWHRTQREASGRASSLPSGIGTPQSAHCP